jgi:hypothetical protein
MRSAILAGLVLCAAAAPVAAEPLRSRVVPGGVVLDFDPTSPGLHEYAPPTPIGRGYGNAYLGAGYIEFLYSGSGSRTPSLPPRRIYAGPLEQSEPYSNRRVRLRQGMSPRAGNGLHLGTGVARRRLKGVTGFTVSA